MDSRTLPSVQAGRTGPVVPGGRERCDAIGMGKPLITIEFTHDIEGGDSTTEITVKCHECDMTYRAAGTSVPEKCGSCGTAWADETVN